MRRWAALLIAVAMIATACTNQSTSDDPGDGGTGGGIAGAGDGPAGLFASALETFDSCDAFLGHVKTEALEHVGPYGFNSGGGFFGPVDDVAFAEEAASFDAAGGDDSIARAQTATTVAAADGLEQGVDFSGTNVQELGVDEPDIIKTDGERIIAVAQGSLIYFDVTPEGPVQRGQVALQWGWNQDLLLSGDTVVVMTTMSRWDLPEPLQRSVLHPDYGGAELSGLVEVDISNPDDLRVGRRVFVDGRYVSARMVGDTARVVLTTQPVGLDFVYPASERQGSLDRATEVNRSAVENSTIENWVPYYVVEDGEGNLVDEGSLVDCENAHYPSEFSGFGMLSVLTFGLDDGVDTDAAVGVLAAGETVYASQTSLYVGSQRWVAWQALDEGAARREAETLTTNIHKFDISDPSQTTYQASGAVDGFLLNQFSLSEHEGHLRVAATTRPNWWWWGGDDGQQSESFVSVFRQDGDRLIETGSVGGLGLGEQIFAVRFLGDVGYVVTFRQVDPLYTIDLSDPTNPRATGELKIPGFSSYLHPIGEDLLLGVGQEATEEGWVQGLQVSVFDVSDMENPQRLHQWILETDDESYSSSEAEYDHRAFLHWAETGTTVLPITQWSWDESTGRESAFFGAVVLEAGADGIQEVGRISHDRYGDADENSEEYYYDWGAQVRRSMVIGDSLYTLSEIGLMASDLSTLDTHGVVYFDGFSGDEEVFPVEPDGGDGSSDSAEPPPDDSTTDTTTP